MAASVCIVLPQLAQITSKFHDRIYEECSAPKADFRDLFDVLVHKGDSKTKLFFLFQTTLLTGCDSTQKGVYTIVTFPGKSQL